MLSSLDQLAASTAVTSSQQVTRHLLWSVLTFIFSKLQNSLIHFIQPKLEFSEKFLTYCSTVFSTFFYCVALRETTKKSTFSHKTPQVAYRCCPWWLRQVNKQDGVFFGGRSVVDVAREKSRAYITHRLKPHPWSLTIKNILKLQSIC